MQTTLIQMRPSNAKAALQKFHVTPSRGGAPSLVHVMDDETDTCYHVPAVAAQVPATLQCAVKLRLCRNMTTLGRCEFGSKCMFVHVHPDVLKHCEKSQVHTNFAWKTLEEVPYERHQAGSVFHVLKPKETKPDELRTIVPSECVLVTRGSVDYEARAQLMFNLSLNSSMNVDTKIQPTPLCAHYFINRSCRLGHLCHFIHIANTDQSAAPGKKAKKRASLPSCCDQTLVDLSSTTRSRRNSSRDFLSESGQSTDDLTSPCESSLLNASSTSMALNASCGGYYTHNPYSSMRDMGLGNTY